ncbi:MAG: sugar ABC transporter permease [Clostridiales bacterium]|jgi:multiple sugar transport system permease protein|nr:sugar ABC transporter permease [Clostridiales bacterium]
MRKENLLGYLLIAPAVALITFICVIPLSQTILYSLRYYNLTDQANERFIGLENYFKLFSDSKFYDNLANTMIFAAVSVVLQLLVGLTAALLMNAASRGAVLVRAVVLVPYAIPGVIVAQMFSFMFHGDFGVLNALLRQSGILSSAFPFLAKPGWAMACIIITNVWKQFPFVALLLLSGLQTIPAELYESAEVDGAGALKRFAYITLPGIRQMVLVVLLFRTMADIRIFDLVYSMTGGGPANTTSTLLYQAYIFLFKDMNFGLGSAWSTIIFFIILTISLIYLSLFQKEE